MNVQPSMFVLLCTFCDVRWGERQREIKKKGRTEREKCVVKCTLSLPAGHIEILS